jgi:hypothetical protein
MRLQFIAMVLALSLVTAFGSVEALPDHSVILPVSEGPALTNQCSRLSPKDVDGFWSPSPSQVNEVEQRLPELLSKSDVLNKSGYKLELSEFCRQYVGITVHGKRLIYLNAFSRAISKSSEGRDWRTKAITACDGGFGFWGVVFDPADNTFHDLQFNGVA